MTSEERLELQAIYRQQVQADLSVSLERALTEPRKVRGAVYEGVKRERRETTLGDFRTGALPVEDPEDAAAGGGGGGGGRPREETVDLELCDGKIVRVFGFVVT